MQKTLRGFTGLRAAVGKAEVLPGGRVGGHVFPFPPVQVDSLLWLVSPLSSSNPAMAVGPALAVPYSSTV